jgi:hypothetical protein
VLLAVLMEHELEIVLVQQLAILLVFGKAILMVCVLDFWLVCEKVILLGFLSAHEMECV